MKITLKDGSVKEYGQSMAVIDVARDLSEGLARVATCAKVDGEVKDLRTVLDKDCELEILTFDSEEGKGAFNHTASHIMAQAVKRLYPETKLAIGPSIANGFYYDLDRETPFTTEDLEKIEAEMKKIVKEDLKLERFTRSRDEAVAYFKEKEEPYKVELVEDLPEGAEISFYSQGEFTDLCAGPHLMSTKAVKAFKLTSLAGAYWRGDEKNKGSQETGKRAGTFYDERRGTGLPLLPAKGNGTEEHPSGLLEKAPPGERLCRGVHTYHLKPSPVGELRTLGSL